MSFKKKKGKVQEDQLELVGASGMKLAASNVEEAKFKEST
jgi:hypothetical protein